MVYVYAVVDRPRAPLPTQPGLFEAPLRRVISGAVASVYSSHDRLDVEPTEEALWRHEAVVEALMVDRAVLPVRFGTVLGSRAVLRGEIDSRRGEYEKALERVRGRVELGLRVLCEQPARRADRRSDPGALGERAGTAYLRGRVEAQRRARVRARGIHEHLAPLGAMATARSLQDPSVLLAASYLVDRDAVEPFRDEVSRLQEANPDVTFVCTGPWPPYNFVSDGDR